jgi:16S rRNA (uracil1498-N3)-methyltransferase
MIELPRFFVATEVLQSDLVVLQGEPLHHLQNVLRLQPGADVLLLDGSGLCCRVRLTTLARRQAVAEVTKRWQSSENLFPISLLQALPKGDKFDLVLQKGTELGITDFLPLLSNRSVPSPDPSRLVTRQQRWQRIVQEACRQCRRDRLPFVKPLRPLAEVLEGLPTAALKLALWESGARPLAERLPAVAPSDGIILLVGPEGGFGRDEIEMAASKGFQPVHLGPRILRTETAGLAVTPVLQYLYGDWKHSPPAE